MMVAVHDRVIVPAGITLVDIWNTPIVNKKTFRCIVESKTISDNKTEIFRQHFPSSTQEEFVRLSNGVVAVASDLVALPIVRPRPMSRRAQLRIHGSTWRFIKNADIFCRRENPAFNDARFREEAARLNAGLSFSDEEMHAFMLSTGIPEFIDTFVFAVLQGDTFRYQRAIGGWKKHQPPRMAFIGHPTLKEFPIQGLMLDGLIEQVGTVEAEWFLLMNPEGAYLSNHWGALGQATNNFGRARKFGSIRLVKKEIINSLRVDKPLPHDVSLQVLDRITAEITPSEFDIQIWYSRLMKANAIGEAHGVAFYDLFKRLDDKQIDNKFPFCIIGKSDVFIPTLIDSHKMQRLTKVATDAGRRAKKNVTPRSVAIAFETIEDLREAALNYGGSWRIKYVDLRNMEVIDDLTFYA